MGVINVMSNKKYTITGSLKNNTTAPSPRIDCYIPSKKTCHRALVIFPGGGYHILAQHEGEGYAKFFCKEGYHCFVVNYRLGSAGHRHPAMLEDAMAAMETVRCHLREIGSGVDTIGVMGSSAGGHLASMAMTSYGYFTSNEKLRPDFGILCYALTSMDGEFMHKGSRNNLVGEIAVSEEFRAQINPCSLVNQQTPPCFLWHTVEDQTVPVEHSIEYAVKLRKYNIPVEVHLYQKGKHGLGLEAPFAWEQEALRWIGELFEKDDQ